MNIYHLSRNNGIPDAECFYMAFVIIAETPTRAIEISHSYAEGVGEWPESRFIEIKTLGKADDTQCEAVIINDQRYAYIG